MLQEMLDFAFELRGLFADGATLREICRYSYNQREAGRNVPVLKTVKPSGNLADYTLIEARPVQSQKAIFDFFNELAPGCAGARRYELRVTAKGVSFTERTGRGKTPQIDLMELHLQSVREHLHFAGILQ